MPLELIVDVPHRKPVSGVHAELEKWYLGERMSYLLLTPTVTGPSCLQPAHCALISCLDQSPGVEAYLKIWSPRF